MLLDWFTILAQIVNFLILVFLLRRFLYKPVLKAIAEREHKIASSLQDAQTKMQDAETTRDLYQEKVEDFERQKAERFQELSEEVESERRHALDLVKADAERESDRHRNELRQEAAEFEQAFRRQLATVVMDALERVLQDLAGQSLEQQIVQQFVRLLQQDGQRVLPESATSTQPDNHADVLVASTWVLSEPQRQQLSKAITAIWPQIGQIRYDIDPNQICGLSLHWGGYQLSWHVDDYLSSMHESLDLLVPLPETQSDDLEQADHEE